jgi:hypothetical protein
VKARSKWGLSFHVYVRLGRAAMRLGQSQCKKSVPSGPAPWATWVQRVRRCDIPRHDRSCSQQACKAANIDDLKFHDLRHESGSQLLEAGGELREVQATLGHATLTMTGRSQRDPDGRAGGVQETRCETPTCMIESCRLKQMTKDCQGREVKVGSRVRLLKVAESLQRDLPPNEWTQLQGMVGKVFEVTEIDEYGGAWIEKLLDAREGGLSGQSYSLAADEMELVTE